MAYEWQYFIDIRATHKDPVKGAAWETAVRDMVMKIAKSDSGKVLLNSLKFHGRWVVIWPRDTRDNICSVPTWDKTGTTSSGRTYSAQINFSPGMWSPHSVCHKKYVTKGNDKGAAGDEIIFHELVHAFRRSSSKRARVATSGGLADYGSNEEFYAILATNIYSTDPTHTGRTGPRRDHASFDPLEASLTGNFEFFQSSTNAFSMIDTFCKDNPGFTGALAKVKSTFNPFTAYYGDKKKAEENSRTSQALVRDATGWGRAMWDMINPF